jgi:hypothetical protein
MATVEVTRSGESDDPLTFDVRVTETGSESRHVVTLQRADAERLGDRFSSPDDFVRRCFEFLLERESKESILARFDVRDIGRYFPEFERDLLPPGA